MRLSFIVVTGLPRNRPKLDLAITVGIPPTDLIVNKSVIAAGADLGLADVTECTRDSNFRHFVYVQKVSRTVYRIRLEIGEKSLCYTADCFTGEVYNRPRTIQQVV